MQWQTKLPLIAILRGIKPDEALAHVGAVIDAGFDAVEIPLNSPQWEQSIPAIVDAYGDKALIGAGTVLKPEQVDALARMSCQLIVTPNIHSEVIRRAVGYGMTVCPGCATATSNGWPNPAWSRSTSAWMPPATRRWPGWARLSLSTRCGAAAGNCWNSTSA